MDALESDLLKVPGCFYRRHIMTLSCLRGYLHVYGRQGVTASVLAGDYGIRS